MGWQRPPFGPVRRAVRPALGRTIGGTEAQKVEVLWNCWQNDSQRTLGCMKVTAVMSAPVITIAPEATIKAAARLLVSCGISALPVTDSKKALVGIVSEADLLPIETRPDPRAQAIPMTPTAGTAPRTVADVMTRKVVTVDTDCEVSQAARLMIEAEVKRLPVMDGGRLAGIVSRRDLVKVIARGDEDLQAEVDRRLKELGADSTVTVDGGIATIRLAAGTTGKRLAESVALTVPGILEVRFASTM